MTAPFFLRVNDHLELRQRTPEDADELFALTDANRARLRRWLPWLDHCTRPEHTLASIESTLQQAQAGTGLAFCVWCEGRIAGVGGYNLIDRTNRIGHIGYWLGEAFEGRGLMTAANRALVTHGFSALGLRRQTIAAATGNTRSRATAERLGFRLEGVLRNAEQLYGRSVDHALYAQTFEDWEDETRASADRLALSSGTTPRGFSVRAMNPADLREALTLWNATEGMGLSPEETEPMLAAFLARNPGLSAVARSTDGALIGAVLAGHDGRRGFLYHLAVTPAHRGQGGGRALASFALAGLRAAGIARTSLLVYANNEAGQAFWRQLDWEARNDLVLMQTRHVLDS